MPGFHEDHWVCEYWHAAQSRWQLVDAQIDEVQRPMFQIDFDLLDETVHNFFWEMNRQVALTNSEHVWYPEDNELTLMDCFNVHRGVAATRALWRTFVRISFEVKGVKGAACLSATKFLEDALGGAVLEREKTSEFYEAGETGQVGQYAGDGEGSEES